MVRSGRPENNSAYLGSLDGRSARLFASMSHVQYAPPGYLVSLRGRTLVARRFDARTLTVDADAVDVIEGVSGNSLSVIGAFLVSSNGVLVYGSPTERQFRLGWVDRNGCEIETAGGADFDQFRIAPDGHRIVVAEDDLKAGTRSLWQK